MRQDRRAKATHKRGAEVTAGDEFDFSAFGKSSEPIPAERTYYVRLLADALGQLSATLGDVAMGQERSAHHVTRSLGALISSLGKFVDPEPNFAPSPEGGSQSLSATLMLLDAVDQISMAIGRLARGADLTDTETMRHVFYADAKMLEAIRFAPADGFQRVVRELWGRDAAPVAMR